MTPSPKRKPGFLLPTLKLKSSSIGGMKSQVQRWVAGGGLSEASSARVLKNTPSLRKLDEILKRPMP